MYNILHTYMSNENLQSGPALPASASPSPSSAAPGAWVPGVLRTSSTPAQLLASFRQLLPADVLAAWLAQAQDEKDFYQRAFTPLITLWYCVFQRLFSDHSLGYAVADALAGGADGLSPEGKRLSEELRSESTASFSKARKRLPLNVLENAVRHSAQQIGAGVDGLQWRGWNIGLLDGSTLRLRPYGNISEDFPRHQPGNCRDPYWCLARVVAGFGLSSGVVWDSAIGSVKQSEQALSWALLARSGPQTLWIADRNFGVYSVARAAQAASAHVLLRLTEARAKALAKAAKVSLEPGLDVAVSWVRGSHAKCPDGLSSDPVAGRLIVLEVKRPGFRPQVVYLFTTLTDAQAYPAAVLAQLYGQRWQAEVNLRFLKAELDLGALECKSAEMVRKEWMAGLLAYNLIRSIMVAAAARAGIAVRVVSFSRARQMFQSWLLRWGWNPDASLLPWERLLKQVARCRLPNRPEPRPPEPRELRRFNSTFPNLQGDRAAARLKLQNGKLKS